MLYELRIYEAMLGKLSAVNDRFANHAIDMFKKHGIGIVGFWTDVIGTSAQLTYILKFESMGDRETRWDNFQADPAWQKARADTEKDGPLVARVLNSFMRTTPYSPEPVFRSNIQELRIYEAVPGKLPALNARFADHVDPMFRKYGMEVVGYWTDVVGANNTLTYMLGHASLADRETSWAAFVADPTLKKAFIESEKDGPLVARAHSKILQPTAYSPK